MAFVKLLSELDPVLLEEPWKLRRPHLGSHRGLGLTAGNSPFHEQFKSCGKLPLTAGIIHLWKVIWREVHSFVGQLAVGLGSAEVSVLAVGFCWSESVLCHVQWECTL